MDKGGNHPAAASFEEVRTVDGSGGGSGGEITLGGTYLSVLERGFLWGSFREGRAGPVKGFYFLS
jgi:hypothetical protein